MGSIPFCELCGKILRINFENEIKIGVCSCGFRKEIQFEIAFPQKAKEKEELGGGVFKEEDSPGLIHICEKCGFDRCDFHDLGVQIGDESNVYLYRCKKCKWVERQTDGNSIH